MLRLRLAFICLLLLVSTMGLNAQIRLVGTHSGPSTVEVLRWDANSGVVSNTVSTTAQGYMMGASVFDATTAKYYFRDPDGLQSVSFSPDAADLIGIQYNLSSAEIDMQNGKIFALNYNSSLDFMEYNLADSTETLLLTIADATGYIADGSAYDSNHGIYYFLGVDNLQQVCLYTVTTANANYTYTKTPLNNSAFELVTMDYDNDNDILYGLGHLMDPLGINVNLQIHEINTTTAALTLEADLTQFDGLQIGSNTYDQASHSMIFVAVDSVAGLWAYDTQAHILSALLAPTSNVSEIEADNSDYAQLKYGATSSLDAQPRATNLLAFPNPSSDQVTLSFPQAHEPATLAVYNVLGAQVAQVRLHGTATVLDVRSLPAGSYFVSGLVDGQLVSTPFTVAGMR